MISIRQIDELQFTDVFQNMKILVRKGLVDPELGTISKQAQLLVEHCMRLTPPKSAAQGRKRVRFDLEKIFHPIEPDDMRSSSFARLVRRSDPEAWNAMASKVSTGPLAGTQAVYPTPQLHRANRDRRGRAKRTRFVTLWKQRGALKDIMRDAVNRVGWAKAGWMKAYHGLMGTRAPDFVTKHGQARGIFQDGRADLTNPYVGVYNDTGWGKGGESNRVVGAAFNARNRAMATYFNTTMRLASEGALTRWQVQMRIVAAAERNAA